MGRPGSDPERRVPVFWRRRNAAPLVRDRETVDLTFRSVPAASAAVFGALASRFGRGLPIAVAACLGTVAWLGTLGLVRSARPDERADGPPAGQGGRAPRAPPPQARAVSNRASSRLQARSACSSL